MPLSLAYHYPYDWRRTPFLVTPAKASGTAISLATIIAFDLRIDTPADALPSVALDLETEAGCCRLNACIPLIASGSNGAPRQLARKFGKERLAHPIAVFPVTISDIVPVHSAHVARYGAIPATLHREVGARTRLPVLFTTAGTLRRINRTEALGVNYELARLDALTASLADKPLRSALMYRSLHGVFAPRRAPLRLAAAPVRHSRLDAVTQPEILDAARRLLRFGGSRDDFVIRLLGDASYRKSVTATLRRHALEDGLNAVSLQAEGG